MGREWNGQDNNFGRLLRFRNTVGRWREWAMPMELLRGSGDELRGEEPLFTVHARDEESAEAAALRVAKAFGFARQPVSARELVLARTR